ncbi:MAG TPA: hypothetical protein VIO10_03950 [Candidatus Binatus sp.]
MQAKVRLGNAKEIADGNLEQARERDDFVRVEAPYLTAGKRALHFRERRAAETVAKKRLKKSRRFLLGPSARAPRIFEIPRY